MGAGAPITPKTSVAGLRKILSGLKPSDSGKFFNYSGENCRGSSSFGPDQYRPGLPHRWIAQLWSISKRRWIASNAWRRLRPASSGAKSDAGNATDIVAFDDPQMIINMSVWATIEALFDFTYKTGHTRHGGAEGLVSPACRRAGASGGCRLVTADHRRGKGEAGISRKGGRAPKPLPAEISNPGGGVPGMILTAERESIRDMAAPSRRKHS